MKTEHSQSFQESLSTDNSALVHSVLRAHSPDTGIEHITSQIHFPRSHYAVP